MATAVTSVKDHDASCHDDCSNDDDDNNGEA